MCMEPPAEWRGEYSSSMAGRGVVIERGGSAPGWVSRPKLPGDEYRLIQARDVCCERRCLAKVEPGGPRSHGSGTRSGGSRGRVGVAGGGVGVSQDAPRQVTIASVAWA
jgi:hypothetical protein